MLKVLLFMKIQSLKLGCWVIVYLMWFINKLKMAMEYQFLFNLITKLKILLDYLVSLSFGSTKLKILFLYIF